MKVLSAIVIFMLLSACTTGEQKAYTICLDKGGVAGYQQRLGFPVVVCNDGTKRMIEE